MAGVSQWSSELRNLPDQALQQELQNPTGVVPSYLVLAEAQRRSLLRQAAQKQQQQGQSSTVLQDVVRNMQAQQPPPGVAPAGMTPPRQGQQPTPGQMPTPAPPQNPPAMARGGPLRFADGGGNDAAPSADDIDGWVNQYSQQFGVDPDMARSIMQQESGGNPRAMGPPTQHGGRAIGLFQLMPSTAAELGVRPTDPEQNVKGGIQYYRQMLDQFGGDHQLALAAYNAGPGAVTHYGGVPPFEQTQKYVPAIMGRYAKLKEAQLADQQAVVGPPAIQPQQTAAPVADATPPATPDAQPAPQAADDQDQPVFTANNRQPGRIHQMIDDQQKVIDDIKQRLQPRSADNPNGLIDPYGDENIATMKKIAPTLYGVPPNYLDTLSQQADMRAATVNQLQQEVLNRYHNPSPWEFLSNIAAGMGASKNLTFAGAFGEGVGRAWQARDQDQQQAMQDYDALEKMREGIYNNVESERGRMGQTLAGLLEHQAGITDASRKTMADQLSRATAEQDKLKQMLVPTNKLEAFYNPADYDQDQRDLADKAMLQLHPGWNANRMQLERAAVQALAQRGSPFIQGGGYGTAYDQFINQFPKEAQLLDAKASKYSPDDVSRWVKLASANPEALFTPQAIPKDAAPAVQAGMQVAGAPIPIRPPDKSLAQQAAASVTALTHADRVAQFAQDPWMVQNVFGPAWGRIAKGEQAVGMDIPGATPQQTRDAQDLLTSLNYLFMREGRALFGGRPPQQLMKTLEETSPGVNMSAARFMGALDAVRASANMAIRSNRAYMFGDDARPIVSVPAGGVSGVDNKTGRKVMTPGAGKPWYYMDTGEEWKKADGRPAGQ